MSEVNVTQLRSKVAAVVGTALVALASAPVMAQTAPTVDVSGGISMIEAGGVAVASIGLASFLVFIGASVWKWIRRPA